MDDSEDDVEYAPAARFIRDGDPQQFVDEARTVPGVSAVFQTDETVVMVRGFERPPLLPATICGIPVEFVETVPLHGGGCGDNQFGRILGREPNRPLRAGCSIGPGNERGEPHGGGTMGALLTDGTDLFGLTCGCIFGSDPRVYQPSLSETKDELYGDNSVVDTSVWKDEPPVGHAECYGQVALVHFNRKLHVTAEVGNPRSRLYATPHEAERLLPDDRYFLVGRSVRRPCTLVSNWAVVHSEHCWVFHSEGDTGSVIWRMNGDGSVSAAALVFSRIDERYVAALPMTRVMGILRARRPNLRFLVRGDF